MYNRFWPLLLVITPITLAVGLMIAATINAIMPKQYESVSHAADSRFQIESEKITNAHSLPMIVRELPRIADAPVSSGIAPDQFESTALIEIMTDVFPFPKVAEFQEMLTSSGHLEKVAQALDLPTRWGTDSQTSIRLLRDSLSIERIPDTDSIRIIARHRYREDARDIAYQVAAESYTQLEIQIEEKLNHTLLLENPLVLEHPISNIRFKLILGAVAGLLAGPLLAFGLMWVRRPVAAGL